MQKLLLLCMLLLCGCIAALPQAATDTAKTLDGIVVTGITREALRQTPFNIAVVAAAGLAVSVNFSVSDALRSVPGISQITTGPGISKPVIRGLYGNRVQTVLLGLRFDNQQWQDEHGLGLSILGIDRIEVLKGPSSLLYGTEAMGGVIRIAEEDAAAPNTKGGDVQVQTFSNTYGLSVNGGFKGAGATKHWRLRAGFDSHADYSDGNGHRVLNSRFASYNLKGGFGFKRGRWASENTAYTSYSKFGFIMEDNQDRKPIDGRLSRTFDGPNHAVFFTVVSSENSLQLARSRLQLNGGVHSNLRLENEGGNRVSLNMFLNTGSYNLKWFKPLRRGVEFIAAHEGQYQTNRNFGSRVIIPDANTVEGSLSAYVKATEKKWVFEAGVSGSGRHIKTLVTQNMDYTSGEIYPFRKAFVSANGNAGLVFNASRSFNIKLNASTGYRAPNLAELSSNGLHEGTFRFEIGNPRARAEQNLNTELNVNFESGPVRIYTAVYNNAFRNYIYLAPTGTELFGFDIYRFLQAPARFYGGEAALTVQATKQLAVHMQYATVTGKLDKINYLPFVPARNWRSHVSFSKVHTGKRTEASLQGGIQYVFAQNHPGAFETATPGYTLVNGSVQLVFHRAAKAVRLSLAGENLLNKTYYDHLSRFKYFGIYNMGRTLQLTLQIPF